MADVITSGYLMEVNRLIIGAGDQRREGWKTLDANPRRKPDIIATIPPLPLAVTMHNWAAIEWIHGITSLYPWDAQTVLGELRNVLTPDGKLILEQPDLSKAVANVRWLFGDPDLRDTWHMNRWAYTPETLVNLLYKSGFLRMVILPAKYHSPERDFRVEAYA